MARPKVLVEQNKEASAPDINERFVALRKAAAASRIEGLKTSPAVKALGEQWARGELSSEELMTRTKAQALAELKR